MQEVFNRISYHLIPVQTRAIVAGSKFQVGLATNPVMEVLYG